MFENTPHGLYYTRGSKKVRLSPEPLEITGDDVRLPGTTWDGKPRIVKKPSYRSATSIIRWLVDHGRPDRSSSPDRVAALLRSPSTTAQAVQVGLRRPDFF